MTGGFIVLFILVGLMVTSAIFFQRAKRLEQQQNLPPGYGGGSGFSPAGHLPAGSGDGNLLNLKINDIVTYFGTDYMLEGRLDYMEDGYTWVTYMLVDGDDVKWLSVEDDDQLEVSLWEEVEDLQVAQNPPEFLEYRGERFRMKEKGRARVNQQGHTRNKMGMSVEYFDYDGDGDNMLSVERWGGSVEVSIGQEIRPSTLDVLPGDQVEY